MADVGRRWKKNGRSTYKTLKKIASQLLEVAKLSIERL
jgi:hypothetical protein